MKLNTANELYCYTEFELVRHPKHGLYVAALDGREGVRRDPFENIVQALYELLLIGYRNMHGESADEDILSFCRNYGFLKFTNERITYTDYSTGRFAEPNAFSYAYDTRPFETEYKVQSHSYNRRYDPTPIAGIAEKYDCFYCEPTELFYRYGEFLLKIYNLRFNGMAVGIELDANPNYIAQYGELTKMWQVDTLMGALNICLYELLAEEQPEIRLCKHCGKPFLPGRTRAEYCSPSCRNVANVKASRQRKREIKQS